MELKAQYGVIHFKLALYVQRYVQLPSIERFICVLLRKVWQVATFEPSQSCVRWDRVSRLIRAGWVGV